MLNWILRLINGNRKQIVCPRCLAEIAVIADVTKPQTCPKCNYQLPAKYILDYEHALPIFIQVFGWTAAGKTMFLDVLRLMMIYMNQLWQQTPPYTYESVAQIDLTHEQVLLRERQNMQPPGSTPKMSRDENQVYIMQLNNMPRWRSRMLVIMDHAGEQFESFSVPTAEIPFLIKTPTTFMFISLPDMLKDQKGQLMNHLLRIYTEAMIRNGVNFKRDRRKLIVVFTKADLISGLPDNLREYLLEDDAWRKIAGGSSGEKWDSATMAEYVERMGRVSDEIKRWITNDNLHAPGGRLLVDLIAQNNIDARYTLISATGQDIAGAEGRYEISPRRVLDPFFWALEFQSY
jgi:hypothetical protein